MGGFSILSEEGLETFGRYYSFYICKVLDNKDPLNMGRLQLINYQINEGYVFGLLLNLTMVLRDLVQGNLYLKG